MKNNRQPIFKMIHLRGVDTNVVEAPKDPGTGEQGAVIERLINDGIDPFNLDEATVLALRTSLGDVSAPNLSSIAASVEKLLKEKNLNATILGKKTIDFDGQTMMLKEIAANPTFQKEFVNQYNYWVLERLTNTHNDEIADSEKRLRIANLLKQLGTGSGIDPGLIDIRLLLKAHVTLPKSITGRTKKIGTVSIENKKKIEGANKRFQEESKRYAKINSDLDGLETVQKQLFNKWSAEVSKKTESQKRTSVAGAYQVGFLKKARNWLFGATPKPVEVVPGEEPTMDAVFFTSLKNSVSEDAAPFVDQLAAEKVLSLGSAFRVIEGSRKELNEKGAFLYGSMTAYRDDSGKYIPPSTEEPVPKKLEYAIKALGWGDLIVSTERLVDYEAREIAHIENVLPGEVKVRNHSKSRRVEEFTETESTEETESEHELETTDRYELQTESEKAIETDFSVSAGVNTSGRYGLTKVETSLDADFSRSQSKSRSSTTNVAKEIVKKAVERTLKKTRKLRRRNVITEIIETNDHTLSNVTAEPDAAPKPISGIYRWVEKIHEVQLRHYGKRFMLEFHIPEPAITLTSAKPLINVGMEPPDDFTLAIKGVNAHSYKVEAQRYQATGVEPPPEKFISVGFAWSSTPDEDADEDEAEDTIASIVTIPADYKVYGVEVTASALPISAGSLKVQISVGGRDVTLNSNAGNSIHSNFLPLDPQSWPDGFPVTAIAHGHFDKTMALNIRVFCILSERAYEKWQVATHAQISAAYQARLLEYQDAVAQAEFTNELGVAITTRPETINRRTEREELKKWAVKIFRNSPIDFKGIINVDGANEVDPNAADNNARPIQFYEEAFEWEQMSYFFYPYFWGSREDNRTRRSFTDRDSRFESFLRAGAARVIVPVTPGYEKRVVMYLSVDNSFTEIEKINLGVGLEEGETPDKIENSEYKTLWAELMQDRKDDVARGSGTLTVTEGEKNVTINGDGTWELKDIDLGREIFIRGNRYEVETIDPVNNAFTLNDIYIGDGEEDAVYVTGSVPFGPSWTVNLPTNLVILDENKEKLSIG